MICLLEQDYTTRFHRFSIDSSDDLDLLPRYGIKGKGILNTVSSCCPGSIARCTDGSVYILNGDLNEWIKLTSNSGGSSGDGSDLPDDYEFATEQDMKKLFGV